MTTWHIYHQDGNIIYHDIKKKSVPSGGTLSRPHCIKKELNVVRMILYFLMVEISLVSWKYHNDIRFEISQYTKYDWYIRRHYRQSNFNYMIFWRSYRYKKKIGSSPTKPQYTSNFIELSIWGTTGLVDRLVTTVKGRGSFSWPMQVSRFALCHLCGEYPAGVALDILA